MKTQKHAIPIDVHGPVSAVLSLPAPGREAAQSMGIITAHGAGNDMENPLLVAFTEGLANAGYPALRFNFPYKEKRRKAPDRMETLEKTWAAVYRFFREASGVGADRIIAAGKSMGGRVASQMAAAGSLPVAGLVFLGYPLHPAGEREKRRDAHLYGIKVPMLFFAGTRDPLCDMATLQSVLGRLTAPWNLEVIEGGDHSFHLPKSARLEETDIFSHIVETTRHWIEISFPEREPR